jgi:ABC-2 type transport system ATP-binding protein
MSQRLGIAAALLGDPQVLMFDEPVNGLDPEGIVWIRNLLRSLADDGRTVFVSSHLMSEMALTADHLIVIGRGKLIADEPIADLLSRGAGRVRVCSPDAPRLIALLEEQGGRVEGEADGALVVRELGASPMTAADPQEVCVTDRPDGVSGFEDRSVTIVTTMSAL